MNNMLKMKLITHCLQQNDDKILATRLVQFAYENCPINDYNKVLDYIDELMVCENEGCDNIEHETNMTDTDGLIGGSVGIVCPECLENGGN